MGTKSIIWSSRASAEYSSLADYLIENWSIKITEEILEEINISINRVSESPEQFPLISKSSNIHKCVVSKQTSIFFISDIKEVLIISLFDNRQNPNNLVL